MRLDPTLLKKLAEKLKKTEKYVREQVSRKASTVHVNSTAYLVFWAAKEEIGTARYLNKLPPHIQEQARSLTSTTPPSIPASTASGLKILPKLVKKRVRSRRATNQQHYVDLGRLSELRSVKNEKFDLRRLIKMCEELNHCFGRGDFIATIALVRSILNHVPPVFGNKSFAEMHNNSSVARSNRESFDFLDTHSRKIADAYLHIPIRGSEVLPTSTQVDFSQSLDVLLGEIVRILK